MKINIIIVFSIFSSVLYGQTALSDSLLEYMGNVVSSDSVRNGTYYDLESAFANKDNVYALDLQGYGLKEFPEVILEFENLTVLRLDSRTELMDTLSNHRSDHYMESIDGTYSYNTERYNFIQHIPCEICTLKNLILLGLMDLPLSKKEIKRIRKCCPNVIIYADR